MIKYLCILSFIFIESCSKGLKIQNQDAIHYSSDDLKKIETQELTSQTYMNWIRNREHGLVFSKIIVDKEYELLYKPIDYIICAENTERNLNRMDYIKMKDEFSGMIYFDFKISINHGRIEFLKDGVSNLGEYQERVKYCAFDMQKDICLLADKDSVPCSLYHFERTYGVVPYGYFLLGFPVDILESKKELTFIFNDQLFDNGFIKFSIPIELLLHLPKLKIS